MAGTGFAKTATWLIRLLQLMFAIILMGILSYMIHQYRQFHLTPPSTVVLPEVTSVLAICICVFSIAAICFLSPTLQFIAAFLDFVICVLYIASSALLRHNYHRHNVWNPLRNELIGIRVTYGVSARVYVTNGLVNMLVAGVIIQIILFVITAILGVYVASRSERRTPRPSGEVA